MFLLFLKFMYRKDIPSVQVPRDLEYERLHQAFEWGGIKCKNYEFCGVVLPDELWWQCRGKYICADCDANWCRELEFGEPAECPVCYETKVQLKFPGSCDHWLCCSCIGVVVCGKETVPGVSPVPFGCPPCPNGCTNPEMGPQCDCKEYDLVLEQWEDSGDPGFVRFNQFIDAHVQHVHPTNKCPMCRELAVYKDWSTE